MGKIDSSKCPLCGQNNLCAMADKGENPQNIESCWCINVDFSTEVLDKVPAESKNLACICERCAKGLALAKPAE